MKKICNFCLKLSNNCSALDEITKVYLGVIFANAELVIDEYSLICNDCICKTQSAFNLKSTCARNEDLIVSQDGDKPESDKLLKAYLEKNDVKFDELFPMNVVKVCRFCINIVTHNIFSFLRDLNVDIKIGQMIETHLPEVSLTALNNSIVCNSCLEKLQRYGTFINNCLDIYKLKKTYSNSKKSDSEELKKFIFENNMGVQYSDIDEIDSTNIKTEIAALRTLNNVEENNEQYEDCAMDNVEIKADICETGDVEIRENCVTSHVQIKEDFDVYEFKYKVEEGLQIKTESVFDDIYTESKANPEILQLSSKIELDDENMKDEVVEDDYLECDSDPKSYINSCSQRGKQQISFEYPCTSKETHLNNNVSVTDNEEGSSSNLSMTDKEGKPFRRITYEEQRKVLDSIGVMKLSVGLNRENLEEIRQQFQSGFSTTKQQLVHLETGERTSLDPSSQLFPTYGVAYEIIKINDGFTMDIRQINCQLQSNSEIANSNDDLKPFFYCEHCDFLTKCPKSLENHQLQHKNPNKVSLFKCDLCDYICKFKQNLNVHLKKHSDGFPCYQCERCEFRTMSSFSYKQHQNLHINAQKAHKNPDKLDIFKCEHCEYESNSIGKFNSHLRTHSDKSYLYHCEHCDYRTQFHASYRRHQVLHKNSHDIKCPHCEFTTQYRSNLGKHLKLHSEKTNRYQCEHCSFCTNNMKLLKRHQHLNHNFYNCDQCSFRTHLLNAFTRHQTVHQNSDGFELFNCTYCNDKFHKKTDLKKHLGCHADKCYQCDFCVFRTKYKSSFVVHKLRHQKRDKVELFECPYCNLKVKHEKSLKRHILSYCNNKDKVRSENHSAVELYENPDKS